MEGKAEDISKIVSSCGSFVIQNDERHESVPNDPECNNPMSKPVQAKNSACMMV